MNKNSIHIRIIFLVALFSIYNFTSAIAQNVRILTATNTEFPNLFLLSDNDNNTFIFGSFGDGSNIQPFPYPLIGCNDHFLAKYDPFGNLLWRKIIGGHNFNGPPPYRCFENQERSFGLYMNKYNNTLVIVFNYQDSIKLDNKMYYSGAVSWSHDNNIIIAGVDLNGEFLWVNNFGKMGDEDFGGLVILPEKIVWAGSVKYNLTLDNKSIERGAFLATMSHTGQINEIKNVFFRQDGTVENTSQIIQLALAKDKLIAQSITQAQAFRMDNVPIPQPEDWSMILSHIDFDMNVESIEIVYKKQTYREQYATSFHVNSRNGDFILTHRPRETDIYFYGDTLSGQTDRNKVYIFIKKRSNGVVKSVINSSGALIFETGSFYERNDFYAFFVSNESDIYTSTDTAYNVAGTTLIKIDGDGKSQIVEVFHNMWGGASTFDAFGRLILGVSASAPLQFQGFSANSIFPSDFFLLKYSLFSKLPDQRKSYLNLFPNPANDNFTIVLPEMAMGENFTVSLFDHQGKLVNQKSFAHSGEILTLPTSHLPAGVYQVSIATANGYFSSKLVVVK